MKGARVRAIVGDVFRIPVHDGIWAVGQVLAKFHGAPLIVVYALRQQESTVVDVDAIVSADALLIANTLPNALASGRWPVIGNRSPDYVRFPLPKYLVQIGAALCVEDFFAERRREVRAEEVEVLTLRKGLSPALVEEALAQTWGYHEVDYDVTSLLPASVLASSRIEL